MYVLCELIEIKNKSVFDRCVASVLTTRPRDVFVKFLELF